MDRDNERTEKYKELNTSLQELYGSPRSGMRMFAVFQIFKLSEDLYKSYAEIIGDAILGFYKISDIPRLFQQKLGVSADESQRMVSQLIEFLSPVVKREEEEARAKKESLQNLVQKFENPAQPPVPTPETSSIPQAPSAATASVIPPAPAEIAELTGNVEPIRTMEGDMNRIHGYGAYRDVYKEDEDGEDASKTEGA